jgi:hypothetical protein
MPVTGEDAVDAINRKQLTDHLRLRSRRREREERALLHFVRRPPIQWMSPTELLRTGTDMVISSLFGKFADKRELQHWPSKPFHDHEYSNRDEIWIDYVSDPGDGWQAAYTIAWLASRQSLAVGSADGDGPDVTLPRAQILILGGDQVYPAPSVDGYDDRLIGPYRAAFPFPEKGSQADMYSLPGNHDWYDGLTNFLRIFCQQKDIGGWQLRQQRSYFAIKLPARWWIVAIDVQLDTYVDIEQQRFLSELPIGEGDKVLLVTARPSWVNAKRTRSGAISYRTLTFVEKEIRKTNAQIVLTVTGDLHHYARYVPSDPDRAPQRITAGGGGAYLSATHTLPDRLSLEPWIDENEVDYELRAPYPSKQRSSRISWAFWRFIPRNPTFAALFGGIYASIGLMLLASINSAEDGLVATAKGNLWHFFPYALGAGVVLAALLLIVVMIAFTDFRGWLRIVTGAAHALVHLVTSAVALYLVLQLFNSDDNGLVATVIATAMVFLAGALIGSLIFGLYLQLTHRHAPRHANDLFAGQGIIDYKNFLRIHIDRNGVLTVYPIKVERVTEKWDFLGMDQSPRFQPRGSAPRAELIETPLKFG